MRKKIIFIDEDKQMLNTFKNHVNMSDFKSNFNVYTMLPLSSLKETIEKINEYKPDAIISDYELNDKKDSEKGVDYTVPYNGADLVKQFLTVRDSFPCFILTSYDDDAMRNTDDINRVYIKDVLHYDTNVDHVPFLGRVLKQITNYQNLQTNRQNRILELIKKSQKIMLNDKEERELIELDTFIEQSYNKKSVIPEDLKKSSHSKKLSDLLHTAEELLILLKDKNYE